MRKALIGLMAAATALTPLAPAAAQNWGGRDSARAERQQQRVERRAERQVQRSERQVQSADPQSRRADRQAQRADRQLQRPERGNNQAAVARAQRSPEAAGWQQRTERQSARDVQTPNRQMQDRQAQNRQNGTVEVAQSRRQWDGRRDGNSQWNGRDGNSQWNGRDGNSQWNGRSRDGNANRDRSGNWDRNRDSSRNWDRAWRNDRRYDWQRYRYANRSHYRPGRYYAPYRGYNYSRFSIGFGLDPLFYSSRYWISDPWSYRLPPAYDGTRWVRYYDDVLLVDLYTGEVVDVIYDFFW
ncbi:MAG: hypothetical protein JWN69_2367 [Alphaproteobacteria bacterium]|nr:hypothetical protein [Alphaproteobacteria bacterium]